MSVVVEGRGQFAQVLFGGEIAFGGDGQGCGHHTMGAHLAGEEAGIHACERGHSLLSEHVVELAVVSRWPLLGMRSRTIMPRAWMRALWLSVGSGAVVAHERVGEDEQLSGVRGICEGLLVAHHARLKYQLPGDYPRSPRPDAPHSRSVGQHHQAGHFLSHLIPLAPSKCTTIATGGCGKAHQPVKRKT